MDTNDTNSNPSLNANMQISEKATVDDGKLNSDPTTNPNPAELPDPTQKPSQSMTANPNSNTNPNPTELNTNSNPSSETLGDCRKRPPLINDVVNNLPKKTFKESKHSFLGSTLPPTQPPLGPIPVQVLMLPSFQSQAFQLLAKEGAVKKEIPFVSDEKNVCSAQNCTSIVTRKKHPNSKDKYKMKQYICRECYEKRKAYQNNAHTHLHRTQKSESMTERVLGW